LTIIIIMNLVYISNNNKCIMYDKMRQKMHKVIIIILIITISV